MTSIALSNENQFELLSSDEIEMIAAAWSWDWGEAAAFTVGGAVSGGIAASITGPGGAIGFVAGAVGGLAGYVVYAAFH